MMTGVPFSRALPVLCCLVSCACSSGAASGGQTAPPSPQMLVCGQSCQDDATGYALDDTMWLLWNENIAGQTSGGQNLMVQCPLNGMAGITGTTSVASNGINTLHLTLALKDCANSNTTYSLAFTGSLTWDGSCGAGSPNAVTFKSSALNVTGTVRQYDMPAETESCAVSLTDTYDKSASKQTGWLNGAVCGRPAAE